jgi:hypothetical protein
VCAPASSRPPPPLPPPPLVGVAAAAVAAGIKGLRARVRAPAVTATTATEGCVVVASPAQGSGCAKIEGSHTPLTCPAAISTPTPVPTVTLVPLPTLMRKRVLHNLLLRRLRHRHRRRHRRRRRLGRTQRSLCSRRTPSGLPGRWYTAVTVYILVFNKYNAPPMQACGVRTVCVLMHNTHTYVQCTLVLLCNAHSFFCAMRTLPYAQY